MIDNLLGGGDDEDSGERSADSDMDGGLFDGAEGGDDDLMGGGDDLMGGGDDEMAFDDMDDGGSATSAEMDNRIDELENEVASLSSTVNTVKSENEQISESVGDVEENIRKLLEVYEMVTRGVNPFVDESEMGNVFGSDGDAGGGGSSMELFGDDEGGDSEDSEVDDSIADADADEFFDDDLDDEGEDEGDDGFGDFDDDIDDGGNGFDEEVDDDFDDFEDEFDGDDEFVDSDADTDPDDEGGKSFEELKAEYDSGDADWDEDESSDDDRAADEGNDGGLETSESGESAVDLDRDVDESEIGDTAGIGGEAGDGEVDTETTERGKAKAPVAGGKPYLESLPSGYVADIVIMDWLEFLVEEAGVDGAARTIAYYEAIEWIDERTAEALQTFLNGFGGEIETDPEPRSSLTVSHHNASLRFISRIVNPDLEMVSFSGGSVPRGVPGETPGVNGKSGANGSNNRPEAIRSNGGRGGEPSREHCGIESDGGRERSGAEEFNWGDDRTE